MKEESKYYIPEIEEFHIGFEYEAYNNRDWFFAEGEYKWVKSECNVMTNMLTTAYAIDKGWVRVKYLDREDIESLGFEIITEHIHIYEKGNFRMYKTESYGNNHYSIQKFDDNQNIFDVFSGTIKNKSELKRILKQIGI